MSEQGSTPAAAPAANGAAKPSPAVVSKDPPPAAGEAKPADGNPPTPPPTEEEWDGTIKVDGKTEKLTPEEIARIKRDASLGKKAQKAIWQAAQERKQLEGVVNALKQDPVGVLRHIFGSDDAVRALMEEHLGRQIQEESLPEERRAERQRIRELEAKERELKQYQQQDEERRQQQQTARARRQLEGVFTAEIKAQGITDEVEVDYALSQMAIAVQALGDEGMPLEDAIAHAAGELGRRHKASRGKAYEIDDPDALIEALGEERARKLARRMAERVSKAAPGPRAPAPGPAASNGSKRRTLNDVFDELAERDQRKTWTR
jgi:predicted nucleic acid-binding protein